MKSNDIKDKYIKWWASGEATQAAIRELDGVEFYDEVPSPDDPRMIDLFAYKDWGNSSTAQYVKEVLKEYYKVKEN